MFSSGQQWQPRYLPGNQPPSTSIEERSLPVSRIHSAIVEYQSAGSNPETQLARIVLITSLGMIPVSEHFQEYPTRQDTACQQINSFLQSQEQYLTA